MTITSARFVPFFQVPVKAAAEQPLVREPRANEVDGSLTASHESMAGNTREHGDSQMAEPAQPKGIMRDRAPELERVKTFMDLPRRGVMMSPARREALQNAKNERAEDHDTRELVVKLMGVIEQSEARAISLERRQTLPAYSREYIRPAQLEGKLSQAILQDLRRTDFTLHPDSSLRPLQAGSTITLETFISENGWVVPKSRDELINFVRVVTRPALSTPPHGNFGGALSWPIPLSDEDKRSVLAAFNQNSLGLADLPQNDEGVLSYLTRNLNLTRSELQNPRTVIQALLDSPKAQALGLALQTTFKGVSTPDSINDWTLAALSASLEQQAAATGTVSPVRTGVAGFDLARKEHWGKPTATVVEGLVNHLMTQGGIRADIAPTAAHLLLSRSAPAFLVKDVPPQLTYGSHAWVSFTTAVARIEAQAPGSSALMTFTQVLAHADTAPTTEREQLMEYAAQRDALVDWGVASGLMPANTADVYTDTQLNTVSRAFNAQVAELSAASQTYSTPMPERKEMALEALRQTFGNHIPFEEKCIHTLWSQRDYPGPYSIVDLYLQGTFKTNEWSSSSDSVPVHLIARTSDKLPDINKIFETKLHAFFPAMEKAIESQVKNLIRNLPLDDRKNINDGEITLIKESMVTHTAFSQHVVETKVPNALLLKTTRNGVVNTYEIKVQENSIRKRNELNNTPLGPQFDSDGHTRRSPHLEAVVSSGVYSSDITGEKSHAGIPNSYASERTQFIAKAMVDDAAIRKLGAQAQGLTTFDTEVPFYKAAREFLLNLVPLRSAIVNFQNGNVGDGIVDLTLDVFGFAFGVGAASKGAKALQAGASAASQFAHGVKIAGRAVIGSLNPLSGVDDLARGVIKGGSKVFNTVRNGLHQLRGVDLASLVRKPGIAEGAFKGVNAAGDVKVVAKLDETTGHWYAIDPQTKKHYGRPLENFQPTALSNRELKQNIDTLYKGLENESLSQICYATALRTAQADKKITDSVFNSLINETKNGVSPVFYQHMKISPETLKDTFNISDIRESGILSFVSKNGYNQGLVTHVTYLHKASDGHVYLYHSNAHLLDNRLGGIKTPPATAGKANVYLLDAEKQQGIQQFMTEEAGFRIAFTPASSLNAQVLGART